MSDENKAQRRAQILDAAKVVFGREGFYATTIAAVAKEADLSYGSVYWYFDSKDALFHALMAECEEALRRHVNAALLNAVMTPADPASPFRAAVRAAFEFFELDRDLVQLLFREAQTLNRGIGSHLAGIYEGFVSDIEEIVADGQRTGTLIDAPTRVLAFSIAALIGQLALRRSVTDDGMDSAQAADFVLDFILNGIATRRVSQLRT